MMRTKITKKADLVAILGEKLSNNILKTARRSTMKRLPQSISFSKTKPGYALGDGDTLNAYGVNLETGEITGSHFCGSAESAINHSAEQFGEGVISMPKNHALLFVHAYWNGRNHSWTVQVVSENVNSQIEGK